MCFSTHNESLTDLSTEFSDHNGEFIYFFFIDHSYNFRLPNWVEEIVPFCRD